MNMYKMVQGEHPPIRLFFFYIRDIEEEYAAYMSLLHAMMRNRSNEKQHITITYLEFMYI